MPDFRKRLPRDICLLLLLLLPYFLALLAARPLNVPDEGRYPEVARAMLLSGDFITPKVNGAVFLDKPALYYWLQALSYQVLGVGTASTRVMPALFGVAGCLLVFLVGRRLFSRRAGWLAAGILASSPLYYIASQYANLDLEVAIWISAALFAVLLGRQAPPAKRRRYFIAAYLAGGCGVLTKGLIGVVLPGLVLAGWLLWRRRWRELPSWHLGWSLPLVLLVCLPWYAAVQAANPQFLHYFFVFQQFERYTAGGFNNAFPWYFYLLVLGLFVLPWSLWLPAALRRAWQRRTEADETRPFLLVWPALILLFFSLPASKIVSYILPVLPPLALLLAAYFDEQLNTAGVPKRLAMLATVVLAGAGGLLLYAIPSLQARYPAAPQLAPWLALLAGVLLAGALLLAWGTVRKRLDLVLSGLLLAAAGTGWCVNIIVGRVDDQTSWPVAQALKPHLSEQALLISYHDYYQDLPIYLNRREPIHVVDNWRDPTLAGKDNWRREFHYALGWQPEAAAWLVGEEGFASLLRQQRPIFVVLAEPLADEVARRHGLRVLWRGSGRAILTRSTAGPVHPVAMQ
ncbi:phospholipid carrier-dependent glycosyltransferase [Chitinimonas arctica]|nr:phospholipid carrier-dependent glycosyltransferase [Chitinimonas arctica]